MRAFLLLGIMGALIGNIYGDCDACLDGHCYKKHLLPGTADRYGAIYRKTNTLYHYYRNSNYEEFIVKCNLDKGTCDDKIEISKAIDLIVDQRTGDLYSEQYDVGIFKIDLNKKRKILWVPTQRTIQKDTWTTVFKDKLYYTVADGGIYVFENGVSTLLPGTEIFSEIKQMVIDKRGDIYFYNYEEDGRFLKKLSKDVVYHTGFWDGYEFDMTVDRDDNPIFIDQTSRAVYKLENGVLDEIGAVSSWVDAPLFDRDNNLVFYEFNPQGKVEAWHFKKEENILCTTAEFASRRIILETVVSKEDSNTWIQNRPLDTAPAHTRTRPRYSGRDTRPGK